MPQNYDALTAKNMIIGVCTRLYYVIFKEEASPLLPPMMKCVCLILLLLTLCGPQSQAQEEFIEPSQLITKMPFKQLTGGVVLLNARFAHFPDTLNFILDTGSGGISLDSLTAVYFGVKPQASNRTIRGIGGIKSVGFLYNQQLHFNGLTVDSLNFHVNDYEVLTSVYGEKIDGIIGYSFLSRYIVKIDYDSLQMEVWTPGSIKYPRGGYMFRPNISTLPVNVARIKDAATVSTRFLYDIGAGLCVMLSTDFVKDSGLLHRKRKLYVKQAEGLGGKIDMHITAVKEFKLGPYKFKNVPIYVFEDTYNITSYPYLGGLIGNDLLRRFNCILNYGARQFYIVPNSHYNTPFDYSYSGIELYLIDGQIVIGDVAVGSPAEKAGLKEGDVVIGINKLLNGTLQQMKDAINKSGGRVKMVVLRDSELQQYDFKIHNILKRKTPR